MIMSKKHMPPLYSVILVITLLITLTSSTREVRAESIDDLFDYHALNLKLVIINNFSIIPTSPNYYLDYVSAEMTWFPRTDYRQEVDYIATEPSAAYSDETGLLFEWKKPSQTSFRVKQESSLTTQNEFKRVGKKIIFPLKNLDPAYSSYLESQEIIDINDEIKQTASGIVQGEDDLYRAVFKLAEWVEDNVKYNLSTLTIEASQKASWVLRNKRGVCDELTSLFISLCRSVGIPARFVTGISYSNINQQNKGWGPHGWAEVYFPRAGWVPFDVTYKELGFVDALHIKLRTSLDAKEPSINYVTRSKHTEIKPGSLDFNVSIIRYDYKLKPLIELSAEVVEDEVGFGSYNLLILKVRNPHSYYVTTRLSLAKIRELEILGQNPHPLLLAPGQEKNIYWLLRVSPDLEPRFIYTFPLRITATRGEQAQVNFKAAKRWSAYSEQYMRLFMITEQPQEKSYSANILLTCSASKEKTYLNHSVNITCIVDNKGDKNLKKLSVCLNDECATSQLPAGERARFEYTKKFNTLGVKTFVFRVKNELVEKSYYSVIEVQDKPLLEILNLSFPHSISYDELSEIRFLVKKKSNTKPRNVKIILKHELMEEHWEIPLLEHDYQFRVILRGEDLNLDNNDFKIIITYEDEHSTEYKTLKEFSISLNNPTLLQRIMMWLNILENKIMSWLNRINNP